MNIISVGDLVLDYYYKNNKLIGINGGMTSHNIIANLAKMGLNTKVFACCGNDIQGKIAIKSLEKLKVNTDNIKIIENTRESVNIYSAVSCETLHSKMISEINFCVLSKDNKRVLIS